MPETMTRDDVIRSTAAHIRRVGDLLNDVTARLDKRAVHHDTTKWSPEEWPAFEASTPKLAAMTYGSPEYKEALANIKPALEHHYAHNRHHPELHGHRGVAGMTLLDLIEMLADWKASTERHNEGSLKKSLLVNAPRFGIPPELIDILANTAEEMGWMPAEVPQTADA